MKYLPIIALLVVLATSCKNTARKAVPVSDVHEVKVEEVLQANNYINLSWMIVVSAYYG